MKEVHLSFHSNGYNPNLLKSIGIIALTLDFCAVVLRGSYLGKVCNVLVVIPGSLDLILLFDLLDLD